jgi:hypothetical protein
MTRPTYENAGHRAQQRAVADRLEAAWHVELAERGARDPCDYDAWRYGERLGLVEVKCRTHSYAELVPVRVAARKWLALVELSDRLDVPAFLVFRFGDGEIRYVDVSLISSSLIMGGRADRHDRADREAMCTVPLANTLTLHA